MATFKEVMTAVGHTAAKAGAFVGTQVAYAYRSVDPDVMRHASQLPLMSYSLFARRPAPVEPGTPDGYPPLLFVHGLGGGRGDFLPMAGYLWVRGRKRSYRVHFDGGTPPQEQASQLAAFVEEVLEVTGESQVEIVAHSLGGVAARLAILDHDLGPVVKTLITLGSPHGGTYPARYGNTLTTRDLRPESELIVRLSEAGWPEDVRGVTLYSHSDLVILPALSAAVPGTEQRDMTPFTHYSYLIDPDGWAAVATALEG
jgi:pimeloyl-ACP methyl ester carboxylesterase